MVIVIVVGVIVLITTSFYFFRRGYKKSQEDIDFITSRFELLGKVYDNALDKLGERSSALNITEKERNLLLSEKVSLQQQIETLAARCKRLESQKKSSEVRTGQIAEKMAPFLEGFPYEPQNCHFLGSPIDFISFTDEEICFIEVKSGKSRLTRSQKNIRDLVSDGRVKFEVYRVEGDG